MERWARGGTTGWAPSRRPGLRSGGPLQDPRWGLPLPVWRGRDGGWAQLQASVCLKFQHLQNIGPQLSWGDIS